MNKTKVTELERTSIHEAGHAVVSVLLEEEFLMVSVIPHENISGYVLGLDFKTKTRDSIIKSIVILMAGYMSEYCYFGVDSDGANSDKEEAHRLIRHIEKDPEEIEILLEAIDKFTYRLLSEPAVRLALKAVAKELMKKEILTNQEVQKITEDIINTMEEEI